MFTIHHTTLQMLNESNLYESESSIRSSSRERGVRFNKMQGNPFLTYGAPAAFDFRMIVTAAMLYN